MLLASSATASTAIAMYESTLCSKRVPFWSATLWCSCSCCWLSSVTCSDMRLICKEMEYQLWFTSLAVQATHQILITWGLGYKQACTLSFCSMHRQVRRFISVEDIWEDWMPWSRLYKELWQKEGVAGIKQLRLSCEGNLTKLMRGRQAKKLNMADGRVGCQTCAAIIGSGRGSYCRHCAMHQKHPFILMSSNLQHLSNYWVFGSPVYASVCSVRCSRPVRAE